VARVFVLKFNHGDILLEELARFVKKEKIKTATMVFIGALHKGDLAAGPKKPILPPQPNRVRFKDGWEVMGIGTVFFNSSGGQIHIHGSLGQKVKTLTGCVRGATQVFGVIEAVVFELKGVKATKSIDGKTGINLLRIGSL
jgi:hypothetical protein